MAVGTQQELTLISKVQYCKSKNIFFIFCICLFYIICVQSIIILSQHSPVEAIVLAGYLG